MYSATRGVLNGEIMANFSYLMHIEDELRKQMHDRMELEAAIKRSEGEAKQRMIKELEEKKKEIALLKIKHEQEKQTKI